MKRKNKGILLGMAASCTYGTNPLFALPLFALGMGVNSVLFYRYFFAVVLFGIWLHFFKKTSLRISWKDAALLFFLGTMFSISSLTLFIGYTYVGAGIASTILFVYPIFVAVIMAVFFKEKISFKTIISIVLMSAGIILFYKGDDGKSLNMWGITSVLISAASYALYMICLKKMPQVKHIHFPVLTFYVMFFGLFVFLANLKFGLNLQKIESPFMLGCVLGAALIPTIISLETMNVAIKFIGPTLAAILGALEPVTAVFIGVLVFGESMTLRIAAGICLILCSVLLLMIDDHKKAQQQTRWQKFISLFRR